MVIFREIQARARKRGSGDGRGEKGDRGGGEAAVEVTSSEHHEPLSSSNKKREVPAPETPQIDHSRRVIPRFISISHSLIHSQIALLHS